jgi:hypothetical protein
MPLPPLNTSVTGAGIALREFVKKRNANNGMKIIFNMI